MGATLTAALIHGLHAYVAEVGDSRAYLLRGGALEQVTRDQSYVQFLVDQEGFSREQARKSNLRNVVLQAIGQGPQVRPALQRLALRRGDRLLLCSDGLSNKLNEDEMREILRGTPDLDAACARLIDAANEHGGDDNITVILSAFDGPDWPEAAADEIVADTIVTLSSFEPLGEPNDP